MTLVSYPWMLDLLVGVILLACACAAPERVSRAMAINCLFIILSFNGYTC